MSTDLIPADFDLDEWIAGVRATERSVEIYQRGDLVAVAEDLIRRHEMAERVKDTDRGISDDSPDALLIQLEDVQRQLSESMAVWTVRALSPEQIKKANAAAKKAVARSKKPGVEPDATAYLIAAAVTQVRLGDGRVKDGVTGKQIQAMRDSDDIGPAVVMRLWSALAQAMSEEPSIQAPFSRGSSPTPDGTESSPS